MSRLKWIAVLADDRIKHFFDDVDMEKQIRMQRAFFTYAFGGADQYKGRTLRDAHARLVNEKGLNDSHFDAIVEHLASTLTEVGASEDVIKEAVTRVDNFRNDVLNR
jgi:hemoglobin